MIANDVDGDGRSEIVVTSPWGIGVLGLGTSRLTSQMLRPNGSRIGQWLLQTGENQFGPIANFGGDAKAEVFAKSGWGVGLLRLASSTGESPLMAPNGTRFGGWLLNTQNDAFGPAGDFDGDGLSELIVQSGWGIGILKQAGNTFAAPFMAPNGTRLGDWMLNAPENRFGPVGDFDGDGRDEILALSLWGIGVLKLSNGKLSSIAMLPNGTTVGGWRLSITDCRILAVGDFDGDGRDEMLAADDRGIAVLKLSGGSFTVAARVANGAFCGGWQLNTAGDRLGTAADFDGDGKAEIFVSSNWGIGILKLSGSTLTSIAMAPNGTRLGDWMLNTHGDRLNRFGNFSGGKAAEILVSSGWGAGLLKVSGDGFTSMAMAANQTKLGQWRLNTLDNDLEHGDQQCHALVLLHNDWSSTAPNTAAALRRRGYTVHYVDDAAVGLRTLQLLSTNLKAGDRMFVYVACHGIAWRQPGDFSQNTTHQAQTNNGMYRLAQGAPYYASIGNRHVDLTVFDGSCDGGETVNVASGQRYSALATTGLWSPAYVNTPDPSAAMATDTKPGRFGLWWAQPHVTASWTQGHIMSQVLAHGPQRLHQRLFRNDVNPIARTALLVRSAICMLVMPGSHWYLDGWNCHLFQYIKADLPESTKARLTTSTEDYIGMVESFTYPKRVLIEDCKRYLRDFGLIHQAGFAYAANFDLVWRTVANDPTWDVRGNPNKHRERMCGVAPNPFRPEEGFKLLANQALNGILMLEEYYRRQISLLRQMDAELKKRWRLDKIPAPKFKELKIKKPTWRTYLSQNAYDIEEAKRLTALRARMKVKTEPLVKLLEREPPGKSVETLKLPAGLATQMTKITTSLDLLLPNIQKVRQLGNQINAISADQHWHLWRLNILLGIVEDAVGAVLSRSAVNPADRTLY